MSDGPALDGWGACRPRPPGEGRGEGCPERLTDPDKRGFHRAFGPFRRSHLICPSSPHPGPLPVGEGDRRPDRHEGSQFPETIPPPAGYTGRCTPFGGIARVEAKPAVSRPDRRRGRLAREPLSERDPGADQSA